jgi:hypothetical protein
MTSPPSTGGGEGDASASTPTNAGDGPAAGALVGKMVKIVNTARYDNACGRCTAYNSERQRYTIQINAATVVSIRAESTIAATTMESIKFQGLEMTQKVQIMANDPVLHRQVLQFYQQAQTMLPKWLPPERLLLVWIMLSVASLWYLGVSKTFLLGSTLSLPIAVSLPDVVNNRVRDPKVLLKNFPRNIKASIVRATGGRYGTANMDERFALGGFMIIIAMTVRILLTSTPAGAAAAGSMATDSPSRELSASMTTSIETTLKEMYHLGFVDAASREKTSGESLTEQVLEQAVQAIVAVMPMSPSSTMAGEESFSSDDFDYNYAPPPPPKQGMAQKMGFTTIMAGMNIYRTLSQLGNNPNGDGFDPKLMLANVKILPPWQLGLLGLSVFRIVSVFL